jgi:hypothetical protein
MSELTPDEQLEQIFENTFRAGAPKTVVNTRGYDTRTHGMTDDEIEESGESFWAESPLALASFVVSKDHMNQPPLSERQQADIDSFLGVDPKRVFLNPETMYRVGVLLWGKGGGKDWLCSIIQCWVVHILLCMTDPRLALGMPVGEPMDIINVAYSADQAKDVFFSKFLGRLKNWTWLWRKYLILESNRKLNPDQHPLVNASHDDIVHIKGDEVRFPFKITAYSAHSENESYEGKSPIFWIMDEAAAFRDKGKKANGAAVYKTLKSSAVSRYPNLWRGLLISYPRSKIDFMMQMYDAAASDPTTFSSRAATWEVNPTVTKEDFADEYVKDPKDARAKYECRPPGSEFGFFDEDMVGEVFIPSMASTVFTSPALIKGFVRDPETSMDRERTFVGKILEDVSTAGHRDKSSPRVVHVDGGLTGDNAGMCIAHGVHHVVTEHNPETRKVHRYAIKKLVVDALLIWRPDKVRRFPISLNNVASIIIGAKEKGMRISAVSYDQWNSASSVEALTMEGLFCDMHNINTDDYTELRNFINLGAVEIPVDKWTEWALARQEMEQLEGIASGQRIRVDHPEGGSKELTDCLAGCLRLLNNPEIRDHSRATRAPRIQKMIGADRSVGSPFAGTAGLRGRQQDVVRKSVGQSRTRAEVGRIVAGESEELPHTNKKGQAFKPPRPRMLGR